MPQRARITVPATTTRRRLDRRPMLPHEYLAAPVQCRRGCVVFMFSVELSRSGFPGAFTTRGGAHLEHTGPPSALHTGTQSAPARRVDHPLSTRVMVFPSRLVRSPAAREVRHPPGRHESSRGGGSFRAC